MERLPLLPAAPPCPRVLPGGAALGGASSLPSRTGVLGVGNQARGGNTHETAVHVLEAAAANEPLHGVAEGL